VQKEALIVQLKQQDELEQKSAHQKLNEWFESEETLDKINALKVAAQLRDENISEKILKLMQDKNPVVRQAAFKAAGVNRNGQLSEYLFNSFVKDDPDNYAFDALKK